MTQPTPAHVRRLLAIAAACAMGAPAHAQTDTYLGSELRPVEAGSVDSSPLAGEMRLIPIDMRLPTGFDQVYELPQQNGSMFTRIDGGLRAVFPRSEYILGYSGVEASVPAGTTWIIGDTPAWFAQQQGTIATEGAHTTPGATLLRAHTGRSNRVDLSAGAVRPFEQIASAGGGLLHVGPSVFTGTPASAPRTPRTASSPGALGEPAIDLAGVFTNPDAMPRTVIAGEGAPAGAPADRTAPGAPVRRPATSPWSDDAERGRTVGALLARAAGEDDEASEPAETEAVAGADATTDG